MRISDWSSDVCSSDLIRSSTCQSCPTKSLCVLMTLNAISHDITAWTMMIHQRMLSRIERISRNMKYKARSPAERSMASVLAVNERARTPGGEHFEQHRVRNASVADDRRLDPRIDSRDAGLDLRRA